MCSSEARPHCRPRKEEIPAKAIKKDGTVEDRTLYVKGLTEDEKTIILEGCLMNYYAAQNK